MMENERNLRLDSTSEATAMAKAADVCGVNRISVNCAGRLWKYTSTVDLP